MPNGSTANKSQMLNAKRGITAYDEFLQCDSEAIANTAGNPNDPNEISRHIATHNLKIDRLIELSGCFNEQVRIFKQTGGGSYGNSTPCATQIVAPPNQNQVSSRVAASRSSSASDDDADTQTNSTGGARSSSSVASAASSAQCGQLGENVAYLESRRHKACDATLGNVLSVLAGSREASSKCDSATQEQQDAQDRFDQCKTGRAPSPNDNSVADARATDYSSNQTGATSWADVNANLQRRVQEQKQQQESAVQGLRDQQAIAAQQQLIAMNAQIEQTRQQQALAAQQRQQQQAQQQTQSNAQQPPTYSQPQSSRPQTDNRQAHFIYKDAYESNDSGGLDYHVYVTNDGQVKLFCNAAVRGLAVTDETTCRGSGGASCQVPYSHSRSATVYPGSTESVDGASGVVSGLSSYTVSCHRAE
jgi:hypothetical protein